MKHSKPTGPTMADVYEDEIKHFHSMIAFMSKQHDDPLDQLVARFLNLRWDADVTCDMLKEDSAAHGFTLHTTRLADAVLAQVQKLRRYDFLEHIVDNLESKNALLLDDTLAINQAPDVFDNIAHYMAIAEFCENQIRGKEVWLSMKEDPMTNSENSFFAAGYLTVGDVTLGRHEMGHYLPDSPASLEPHRLELGHLSIGGQESAISRYEGFFDDAKKLIRLETLVAPHITEMPELKDNELFWKLVEQCEDAISYAASAGLELNFMTSHSGFGGARNKVMLMIADIPCGIEVTDDKLDDGKFRVLESGMQRRDIKSGANLLKYVKQQIG